MYVYTNTYIAMRSVRAPAPESRAEYTIFQHTHATYINI